MSLFFFNIIQSIRDKDSHFEGDFYVLIWIGVGMSPCQHGDNADHAHNADHRDSADHGDNGHQFLEEMVPNMLLHFT